MNSKSINNLQKGFTLIELLVVIGILAVLLSITLIAINPGRQFQQANDTKRRSDVNAILNAINQYMADNNGSLPTGIASCTQAAPCTLTNDPSVTSPKVDLCTSLSTQYLAALPGDPTRGSGTLPATPNAGSCTTYNTGYTVYQSSDNRITVSAQGEITTSISVTR